MSRAGSSNGSNSATAVHSLPELIPAAGAWNKVTRIPSAGGRQWEAQSSGLTARNSKIANQYLRANPPGTPGNMNVQVGSCKNKKRVGKRDSAKGTIDDDWNQQKREGRPRIGLRSWTGPVRDDPDKDLPGMILVDGDGPRFNPPVVVESTGIPGIGWGELLARDRYCQRTGLKPFSIEGGKVVFHVFEPAPEKLSKTRVHPMGREADYFEELRNIKTTTRQVHARDWDSSAPSQPRLLERTLAGNALRQAVYKSLRDTRRSWTSDFLGRMEPLKPRMVKKPAELILQELEERERELELALANRAQGPFVTGGSWDLSKQLAVSEMIWDGTNHPADTQKSQKWYPINVEDTSFENSTNTGAPVNQTETLNPVSEI